MEFYLDKVNEDKKDILYRLLEYSLFEESMYDNNEMNDEALFEYKDFDSYFINKDKAAYFIKNKDNNKLLGFIMINSNNLRHSIVEFMIIPKYRRKKLGKQVAFYCFNKYKGCFLVSPSFNSKIAYNFWKNVIYEYTNGNYEYKDGKFIFNC